MFMPFEYVKAGKLTGFDIDLINALSKEIRLTPAPIPMKFKGLAPALQGKRLDIISSTTYVDPICAEQADFISYLKTSSRVVVRKGNPTNITGHDPSLYGKNIAVTLGGIEESQTRANNRRRVEVKEPAINVITFPAATSSAAAVVRGRADAKFLPTPGIIALFTEKAGMLETVGAESEANICIVSAVRKGDIATRTLLE